MANDSQNVEELGTSLPASPWIPTSGVSADYNDSVPQLLKTLLQNIYIYFLRLAFITLFFTSQGDLMYTES